MSFIWILGIFSTTCTSVFVVHILFYIHYIWIVVFWSEDRLILSGGVGTRRSSLWGTDANDDGKYVQLTLGAYLPALCLKEYLECKNNVQPHESGLWAYTKHQILWIASLLVFLQSIFEAKIRHRKNTLYAINQIPFFSNFFFFSPIIFCVV